MQLVRLFSAVLASVAISAAAHAAPIKLDPIEIGENLAEKSEEYGARDIDRLVEELTESVTARLERDGHLILTEGDADLRIAITLDNAWPNRPTREQLADRPGLSMRSISLGGARLSAVLFDASGAEVSTMEYSWRTSHISDSIGRATWSDAERTFDRFARNLADELPHSDS